MAEKKPVELKPIEESAATYDAIEERLKKYFKKWIYVPLLKELGINPKVIKNAAHDNPLMDALFTGKVGYSEDRFYGSFQAQVSRELKRLGATFDKKTSTFVLPKAQLPQEVRNMIDASRAHFLERMGRVDERLAKIVPQELAQGFQCADLFDQALFKADQSFQKNVQKIAVTPKLTPHQRKRIAQDWQDNMNLWIEGWTEAQIKELRTQILKDTLGGAGRESHIAPILKVTQTLTDSHEQAMNKAKFLARQETRLLMATFKQTRYEEAGSRSYIWRCVHRPHDSSPDHHTLGNVRYSHGLLDGKEFEWSQPPVTTNPGQPTRRNHAGQDYNCRCFARALIRES